MKIYKNKYYFDRSGISGNYSYQHNNWSRWIVNSSHGFTKYGLEKNQRVDSGLHLLSVNITSGSETRDSRYHGTITFYV